MKYSDKLRRLADWLEAHPAIEDKLSDWGYPAEYVYASDAIEFGLLVASLGDCEKSGYNGSLSAVHREKCDTGTMFRVDVSVSGVCEAKETGETRVRKIYPMQIPEGARWNPESKTWEIDEPVVEYDCPKSFLGLAHDA